MIDKFVRAASLLCTGVFFALSVTSASAQFPMTVTGPADGPVLDGVYISPYYATVDGVPETVICDDFSTDIYFGYSWTTSETNLSSISGESTVDATLKFDEAAPATPAEQQNDYTVAAYLATEILDAQQADDVTAQGQYSFALWYLFESSAVTNWLDGAGDTTTLNAAIADVANAKSAVSTAGLTPASYSNVTIYSPTPLGSSQEFISVAMPEPSSPALLGIYLMAVLGLAFVLRKRLAGPVR